MFAAAYSRFHATAPTMPLSSCCETSSTNGGPGLTPILAAGGQLTKALASRALEPLEQRHFDHLVGAPQPLRQQFEQPDAKIGAAFEETG